MFLLLISFVLAVGTTYFWEKKFKNIFHWKYIVIRLFAPMFIVICAGVLFDFKEGFASRFPKEIQSLFNVKDADQVEWRFNECFLNEEQSFKDFKNFCFSNFDSVKKRILLWGDSHAAHFYPGVNIWAQKNNYSLLQFNASGCPPIIGYSNRMRVHCKEINKFILDDVIKKMKPDIVFLAGYWGLYKNIEWGSLKKEHLRNTIIYLNKIGIKKIFLIGPVPLWKKSLPEDLVSFYEKFKYLPQYMSYQLNNEVFNQERNIKEWIVGLDIVYISPLKLLCPDDKSCRTFVDSDKLIPTAFDYGHLTVEASKFFFDKLLIYE